MEQTLVVGIVGTLMYFGLPAAKQLFNTLQTPSGTKSLIGSALASARAIVVGARTMQVWVVRIVDRFVMMSSLLVSRSLWARRPARKCTDSE